MLHIPLTAIQFDSATQVRAEINNEVVTEYAAAMAAGEAFPPCDVFQNGGDRYFIGDGWHRLLAAQKNGDVTVNCTVHPGGKEAAIDFALSANARHGLARTNADKRKAVTVALERNPNLSDREIAKKCAVSPTTVASVRPQVSNLDTSNANAPRVGGDGKTYPASQPAHAPTLPDPKFDFKAAPRAGATTSWSIDRTIESALNYIDQLVITCPATHRVELQSVIIKRVCERYAPIPATPPPPRPRNPLIDALAEVEGIPLAQITKAVGRRLASALAEITEAEPDVSPYYIRQHAGNYSQHFPKATLTANALAKWWARCGSPPAATRAPERVVDNSRI